MSCLTLAWKRPLTGCENITFDFTKTLWILSVPFDLKRTFLLGILFRPWTSQLKSSEISYLSIRDLIASQWAAQLSICRPMRASTISVRLLTIIFLVELLSPISRPSLDSYVWTLLPRNSYSCPCSHGFLRHLTFLSCIHHLVAKLQGINLLHRWSTSTLSHNF